MRMKRMIIIMQALLHITIKIQMIFLLWGLNIWTYWAAVLTIIA